MGHHVFHYIFNISFSFALIYFNFFHLTRERCITLLWYCFWEAKNQLNGISAAKFFPNLLLWFSEKILLSNVQFCFNNGCYCRINLNWNFKFSVFQHIFTYYLLYKVLRKPIKVMDNLLLQGMHYLFSLLILVSVNREQDTISEYTKHT